MKLANYKVAILVADGFEEEELTEPKRALEENGAITHIVSIHPGVVRGWNHSEWGNSYKVDKTLDTVSAEDYDALLLPGGVMNPDKLRVNSKAIHFTKDFFKQLKPIAAICHGPWLLIETGEVKNRTLTSFESIRTDLLNAGANWIDKDAVTDGELLTSRKPADIPVFNAKMIELFSLVKERGPQKTAYLY